MRPDDMTTLDELEAHQAHQARAMQVAVAHGYDSIRECASRLCGYDRAETTMTPAEYVLAWWRLRRIDEYYQQQMDHARSQGERDRIADAWERATWHDEFILGARRPAPVGA